MVIRGQIRTIIPYNKDAGATHYCRCRAGSLSGQRIEDTVISGSDANGVVIRPRNSHARFQESVKSHRNYNPHTADNISHSGPPLSENVDNLYISLFRQRASKVDTHPRSVAGIESRVVHCSRVSQYYLAIESVHVAQLAAI